MHEGTPEPHDYRASVGSALLPDDPIVIYTAITAGYDDLKRPPQAAAASAACVAFLEGTGAASPWRAAPLHDAFADPVRNAKIHKVLPHVFLPHARYSLWVDGSVTILFEHSLNELIERYLGDCDLAVFPHRKRTCAYQEAAVCLQLRLDEPQVIWEQVCRYSADGYPADAGLAECSVILRRHSETVCAFNEAWWEEIARGSRRDQLSFDYAARAVGLRYGLFPGTIADTPLFARGRHTLADRSSAVAPTSRANDEPHAPRVYHSGRRSPARRTIAFGRIRDKPSWGWAGFDVARQLSRHYDVVLFENADDPPECDIVFMIKKRPKPDFCAAARRRGTQLIYCPIDVYRSAEEIAQDAEMLRSCALVLSHSERLVPLLHGHGVNGEFVEHHRRYTLPELAPYRDAGFVLWIGSAQYVPFLTSWLEQHPLGLDVKILTDLDNPSARTKASLNAAEIGLDFSMAAEATEVAGCRIHRWSERRQQELLRTCRAAIDVKMTQVFNQYHKPPTKAQQFVGSGIPLAVNADSYSAEYFRRRGFDVASPLDTARWLSHEYWVETRGAAEWLRRTTSLEAVADRYRALIETL